MRQKLSSFPRDARPRRAKKQNVIQGVHGLINFMNRSEVLRGWKTILAGRAPFLSIEITRECPLSCPGCYAYGESHLGGGATLRELNDLRGEELVEGVLGLVRKHKPIHVSLVGGEPLIRHRELSSILPALSEMGVFALVV